jgi:hypothetical protein
VWVSPSFGRGVALPRQVGGGGLGGADERSEPGPQSPGWGGSPLGRLNDGETHRGTGVRSELPPPFAGGACGVPRGPYLPVFTVVGRSEGSGRW